MKYFESGSINFLMCKGIIQLIKKTIYNASMLECKNAWIFIVIKVLTMYQLQNYLFLFRIEVFNPPECTVQVRAGHSRIYELFL